MNFVRNFVRNGILATLLCASCARARDETKSFPLTPLPESFAGAWHVDAVLVDLSTSRTLKYQHNDRRLMGRHLNIRNLSITFDAPESDHCEQPQVSEMRTTTDLLIAKTLAGHGTPAVAAAVGDFKFPLAATDSVTPLFVVCGKGSFGPGALNGGAVRTGEKRVGTWIVPVSDSRIAVRWYDQTVLLLSKGGGH